VVGYEISMSPWIMGSVAGAAAVDMLNTIFKDIG
jgi:hypothetical protein